MQFGRYELTERIAVGGMAEIFKAKAYGAHGFEKVLVLKRILPHLAEDAEFVDMFIDEARVMVQLTHPKIVQVLDFGEVNGQYYIAMEYIAGLDGLALLRICAQHRCRPTTGIAIHIITDVLDALDYAHRLNDAQGRPLAIIHRDISPANIFISETGIVKLGDFGIARAAFRRRQTETGALKGKYGYMAPEMVSGGKVDHRSDLFSVGIVLAELLMIRRLFTAKNDLEVLLQVRDAKLDRLDRYGNHIQPALRTILESALARDPRMRYQDAASFRDALQRYLFDQKQMVRCTDVQQFLCRLRTMDADPAIKISDQFGDSSLPPLPQPIILDKQPLHLKPTEEVLPIRQPPEESATPVLGIVCPQSETGEGYIAQPLESKQEETPKPSPAIEQEIDLAQLASSFEEKVSALSKPKPSSPKTLSLVVPTIESLTMDPDFSKSADGYPSIVGKKRKIMLGPPPKPEPIPRGLAETGDQPRLRTEEMLMAIPELEATSSSAASDFWSQANEGGILQHIRQSPTPKTPKDKPDEFQLQTSDGSPSPDTTRLGVPDMQGDLAQCSLVKLLLQMAIAEETGLLVLHANPSIKEVYLVDGDPQYVTSNLGDELFGQYLVKKGVLSPGELSLALAMLPHFEGKLGNVLVALKLLRPVQVLRHLTYQVRQKLLNAFGWENANYSYYRGITCEHDSAPLGLDAFEVIGAGVLAVPEIILSKRLQPLMEQRLRSVSPPPVPPEAFRLGAGPRQLFDALDGRFTVAELLKRYDDQEHRMACARVLYLLVETGMASY